MNKRTARLIAEYQSGALEGTIVEDPEPIEVPNEVMISRSLRLPMDAFEALQALAESLGTNWSTLVREWTLEALAKAQESTGEVDPVIQLRRGLELATRAAEKLGRAA